MELLRVEHLCKTYCGGAYPVAALRDLSFRVQKGELIAVTGPSGSGKSTLLHLLGAVDTPSSGHIFVDGMPLLFRSREETAIFRRRQVGLVYQSYNLLPTLTVEENIVLPLLLDGRRPDRAYLGELLKLLGLTDTANRMPGELSGGQQQRTAIGRAMIATPAILLADEPTGNLDRRTGQDIISLLRLANRTWKQTVIIATHDESIALQADRVIEMEDGRITGL